MAYSVRNIFKGTATFTTGQLLIKGSGFILIPLYTRFLTPGDYGIIGYMDVFFLLLSVMFKFGFTAVQTRFYYDHPDDKHEIGSLLFTLNTYLVLIMLAVNLILTLTGKQVFGWITGQIPAYPYFYLVIWRAFFQALSQLVITYYLAIKSYARCVVLQICYFLFVTGFVILFVVYFGEGAAGKLKGGLFGTVLFILLFYPGYLRNFNWKLSIPYIKEALVFGLPVTLHGIAALVHQSIGRIVLEKYVPLGQLGIFSLGLQAGMVMHVLVISVNKVWNPNYYELMGQKDTDRAWEIRKFTGVWLWGMGIVCLVGSLWAKDILRVLVPPEYQDASVIVPIVLYSYILNGLYFFASGPIFYFKKTGYLPLITGTSAILNIGLNIFLIPRMGIAGAAYATLVAFGYMAVVSYLVGIRLFNPRFPLCRIGILLVYLYTAWQIPLPDAGPVIVFLYKLLIVFGYTILAYLLFHQYLVVYRDYLVRKMLR